MQQCNVPRNLKMQEVGVKQSPGFAKMGAIAVWRPHILIIMLSGPTCFCSCDSHSQSHNLLIAFVVDTGQWRCHIAKLFPEIHITPKYNFLVEWIYWSFLTYWVKLDTLKLILKRFILLVLLCWLCAANDRYWYFYLAILGKR